MTNIIAGITKDLKLSPKAEGKAKVQMLKADTAESSLCACRVLL